MESAIFSFLSGLVASGTISTSGLILVVILLLCGLSFYLFRPMFQRLKSMPTKTEIEEIMKLKKSFDKDCIDNVNIKLDKVLEIMDKIDDLDANNYREVKEIRRDIETVKQILNQFQGHMMYSKTNDFGNRELK